MAQHAHGRAVPNARRLRVSPWPWLGLIAVALLGSSLAITLRTRSGATALLAERTTHDFGTVVMSNGLISTRFPLEVREATVVSDVNSS